MIVSAMCADKVEPLLLCSQYQWYLIILIFEGWWGKLQDRGPGLAVMSVSMSSGNRVVGVYNLTI
jgi:hypothetical protein